MRKSRRTSSLCVCARPPSHLAGRPEALALEGVVVDAVEGDDGVQRGLAALRPPVGDDAGRAAVDLLALRVGPSPTLVLAARASGIPHDHEAVAALVANHRLIGHRREHSLAVHWTVRYRTLPENWSVILTQNITHIL